MGAFFHIASNLWQLRSSFPGRELWQAQQARRTTHHPAVLIFCVTPHPLPCLRWHLHFRLQLYVQPVRGCSIVHVGPQAISLIVALNFRILWSRRVVISVGFLVGLYFSVSLLPSFSFLIDHSVKNNTGRITVPGGEEFQEQFHQSSATWACQWKQLSEQSREKDKI